MTISSIIKVGDDSVDINRPQDVVTALEKAELLISTGGRMISLEIAGERVVYSEANLAALQRLIQKYRAKCTLDLTGGRVRFARGIRFRRR